MPDLDGFSKRNRERQAAPSRSFQSRVADAGSAPVPVRRGPRDRDDCPAGWDKDVWHLALLFRQGAQADGIELTTGLPVIYGQIDDLVKRYGIRGQTFHHEVYRCERRKLDASLADRCWYHFPPNEPARQRACIVSWVQVVEVIIAEFWSRIQNEHALDQFRQNFAEYGREAVRHWNSLRTIRAIDAQPKKPAVVSQRRIPGATMQDASKEG